MFTGLPSFAPTAANPPAVGARIVSTPQNSSPHSHNRKYTCRPTGLCLYRLRTRAISPSETCVINGWRGMDSVHLLTACSLRAQPRYSPTVGLLHGCKDCLRAEDFICAIRKHQLLHRRALQRTSTADSVSVAIGCILICHACDAAYQCERGTVHCFVNGIVD